jgi:DNA-binding response OmpR family regulator
MEKSLADILLMEDDELLTVVFQELLAAEGHEVTGCTTATEAREEISNGKFDLLITDIVVVKNQKPIPDGGISLINWLRGPFSSEREGWMRRMPIIAISGAIHNQGMSDILRLSEDLGADVTLGKPADTKELLDTIDTLLAGVQSGPNA